jgi:hypothetical protein
MVKVVELGKKKSEVSTARIPQNPFLPNTNFKLVHSIFISDGGTYDNGYR